MEHSSDERIFIISSDIFSNFQVPISLYNISTIEDIIIIFKEKLKNVLLKNNLTKLVDTLEKKNFHIHSYKIEDILTSNYEDYFYICDHS
jgi:hypothetical protein